MTNSNSLCPLTLALTFDHSNGLGTIVRSGQDLHRVMQQVYCILADPGLSTNLKFSLYIEPNKEKTTSCGQEVLNHYEKQL